MNTRRLIAICLLSAAPAAYVATVAQNTTPKPADAHVNVVRPPTTYPLLPPVSMAPTTMVPCQEDDPCWDADTMGNRKYGPAWDCRTMGDRICELPVNE